MKNLTILVFILFVSGPLHAIEQECVDCVQIGKNIGTIHIEGRDLLVAINEGVINIIGNPKDRAAINNFEDKISRLEKQINKHISTIEQQKKKQLLDSERIHRAARYAKNLLAQIDLLNNRIGYLDKHHFLTKEIIKAKEVYDVDRIKELLKKKQKIDDKAAAETSFELAGFHKLDLEYEDSRVNYLKAVSLDPNNPLYLFHASKLLNYIGEYTQAIEYSTKALSIYSKMTPRDFDKVADVTRNLGSIYQNQGMLDKAIEFYDSAIEVAGFNPGKVSSSVVLGVLNDRSTALLDKGDYLLGIKGLKATYEYSVELYGEGSEQTAGFLQNLGSAYLYIDELDLSIQNLESARSIRKSTGAKFRLEELDLISDLTTAYRLSKKYDDALAYMKEGLTKGIDMLGLMHPKVLTLRHELGLIHRDKGEHGTAIDIYVLTLEDWFKLEGGVTLTHETAKIYTDLAFSLYMIDRICDSLMLSRKAYEYYLSNYGRKNKKVIQLEENMKFLESSSENSSGGKCAS